MFRLKDGDVSIELLTPQLARRHVDQVFDVNRGNNSLFGTVFTAINAFHADAFTVFDDQLTYGLIRKNDPVVCLYEAAERQTEHPRATFGHRAPV